MKIILILCLLSACSHDYPRRAENGAVIRKEHAPIPDDPKTKNNESNDQPLGHYGTTTVRVLNLKSERVYTLDADFFEGNMTRLYFPKGGWLDFTECENDENYICFDEKGVAWSVLEEVE